MTRELWSRFESSDVDGAIWGENVQASSRFIVTCNYPDMKETYRNCRYNK
jgi:hypothetical protein